MRRSAPGSVEHSELWRHLGWELDGMHLHELYFGNLGGNGKPPFGGNAAGCSPLLVKNAWEHAFMTDYGTGPRVVHRGLHGQRRLERDRRETRRRQQRRSDSPLNTTDRPGWRHPFYFGSSLVRAIAAMTARRWSGSTGFGMWYWNPARSALRRSSTPA